jgi:probable rRNA maturation factor
VIDVEVVTAPGALAARRSAPSPEEILRLCSIAAASAGIDDGHLAVEFVDERRIAELNARHRGKPQPTDVLSFPIDGADPLPGGDPTGAPTPAYPGEPPPGLPTRELGDVVICPAHTTDLREAIVHGVLHLVGFDHETDDGQMLELQRQLLALGPPAVP